VHLVGFYYKNTVYINMLIYVNDYKHNDRNNNDNNNNNNNCGFFSLTRTTEAHMLMVQNYLENFVCSFVRTV